MVGIGGIDMGDVFICPNCEGTGGKDKKGPVKYPDTPRWPKDFKEYWNS